MVQILIDIPDDLDKKLRVHMAYKDIRSKNESINLIIREYFILRPPKLDSNISYTTNNEDDDGYKEP
jgi:hypothetical protein